MSFGKFSWEDGSNVNSRSFTTTENSISDKFLKACLTCNDTKINRYQKRLNLIFIDFWYNYPIQFELHMCAFVCSLYVHIIICHSKAIQFRKSNKFLLWTSMFVYENVNNMTWIALYQQLWMCAANVHQCKHFMHLIIYVILIHVQYAYRKLHSSATRNESKCSKLIRIRDDGFSEFDERPTLIKMCTFIFRISHSQHTKNSKLDHNRSENQHFRFLSPKRQTKEHTHSIHLAHALSKSTINKTILFLITNHNLLIEKLAEKKNGQIHKTLWGF